MNASKEEQPEPDTTLVTVALVLRTPLDVVSRLKKSIQEFRMTKIVYQRMSAGHLKIVDAPQEGKE